MAWAIKSILLSDIFSFVELALCSRPRTRHFIVRHPSNVVHNVHDSVPVFVICVIMTLVSMKGTSTRTITLSYY